MTGMYFNPQKRTGLDKKGNEKNRGVVSIVRCFSSCLQQTPSSAAFFYVFLLLIVHVYLPPKYLIQL